VSFYSFMLEATGHGHVSFYFFMLEAKTENRTCACASDQDQRYVRVWLCACARVHVTKYVTATFLGLGSRI